MALVYKGQLSSLDQSQYKESQNKAVCSHNPTIPGDSGDTFLQEVNSNGLKKKGTFKKGIHDLFSKAARQGQCKRNAVGYVCCGR